MRAILLLMLWLSTTAAIHFAPTTDWQSRTLQWTAPTAYTNNDPLPLTDISEYRVYSTKVQPFSSFTSVPITVSYPSLSTMQFTMTSLSTGTWFFAVTCVDIQFNESDFSNIISTRIIPPPMPPTLLSIPTGVELI